MEFIQMFFTAVWDISTLMAVYILGGLLAAGVMHEFISADFIKNKLSGRGIMPSVRAAIYGIPLPVCSCGVIPLAASLRKSGAGKGAVTSFFIATPMTGVDSIAATYGVFGSVLTFFRVGTAFVTAVIAGAVIDRDAETDETSEKKSCGCTSSCCSSKKETVKTSIVSRVKNILHYAYIELLGDMAFALFLGILLAAAITMFVTPEMLGGLKGGTVVQYAAAFAVGIPLYVCSVSAIPVALSLIIAGFSPGAAFVFLSASPATNAVTINMVKEFLGKKAVLVYISAIILVTLFSAVLIDMFFRDAMTAVSSAQAEKEGGSFIEQAAAGVMLIYLTVMSVKQKIR